MKTGEALAAIAARLDAAGIAEARREARLILAAAAAVDAAGLLLLEAVPPASFEPILARRERREPLAYIIGHREFWGMRFAVSPATLIPRPESETLIEAALAVFADRAEVRAILDLGTGTGCLLLAGLREFPAAFGIGVDLSPRAAELAAANAASLRLGRRSAFLAGSWADGLGECEFDLVLSNPPYIRRADLAELMPEVRGFEPARALDGGADGLAAYRAILPSLPRLLRKSGAAVLELSAGEVGAVTAMAERAGFRTEIRPDLAGIARALTLRL